MASNQPGDSPVPLRDQDRPSHELGRILSQTTVNPEPVPYWRQDDDGNEIISLIEKIFAGRSIIRTLDEDGGTYADFVCQHHAEITANPDPFALAVDEEGITGVHACAINGYLETLKVLVEVGGASPYAQARGQVGAIILARRRGHGPVLHYLSTFDGEEGKNRFKQIQARVAERRQRKAAVAAMLERDTEASLNDPDASQPSITTTVLAEQRTAKQAEARTKALRASMAAIEKDSDKSIELLPRKFWRAEYAQIDHARGVGYYPRKPLVEETE